MSLFVILIAAGHAIPPIIGAVIGKSKNSVLVGALIACAIAVATGSPAFIIPDLLGVGIGAWLGLNIVSNMAR